MFHHICGLLLLLLLLMLMTVLTGRSSVTRLSGDQKQVLLQRSAEDERHHLKSALTRVCEITPSDADNNDHVYQPSSESVTSLEKDAVDVEPVSDDRNNKPSTTPDPRNGTYYQLNLCNPCL